MEEWFEWFILSQYVKEDSKGGLDFIGVPRTLRHVPDQPLMLTATYSVCVNEEFRKSELLIATVQKGKTSLEDGSVRIDVKNTDHGRILASTNLKIFVAETGTYCCGIYCQRSKTFLARHIFIVQGDID